jgi:hypothetical protein
MSNIAPLSISLNLSGTKTAVPMVADGTMVKLRLVSLTQVTGDKGNSLKFEYDLVDPAPDTEGGTINPGAFGSKIFEQIAMYAKPDAKDTQWFYKNIAQRIDALLGTGDEGNKKGKPTRPDLSAELVPQLIGKELVAKMKVQQDDNFTGNRIQSVTFPGDIAA